MKKSLLDYILRVRLPITLFIIIASFTVTYFATRAERDNVGYSPVQPINFSHKLHAGEMKIDCQYCHTGVELSRHAMVPPPHTCMNCHSIAKKDSPEIKKLTAYYMEQKPIPWVRVHKVPDFVYFNHSVHVNMGIKCESCHGDVAQMDRIVQVHSFAMSACLNCHRNAKEKLPYLKNIKNGPENCYACHR
ncbi:MAG TPA: cytochrome c3 family protein [Ignavibacteriaceae bacterium]|nr:cytochrome c3 family protein [Ignavibacteriaceae bacterium]